MPKPVDYSLALLKEGAPIKLDELTEEEAHGFISVAQRLANRLRIRFRVEEDVQCSLNYQGGPGCVVRYFRLAELPPLAEGHAPMMVDGYYYSDEEVHAIVKEHDRLRRIAEGRPPLHG